jgi:hypothetical protein
MPQCQFPVFCYFCVNFRKVTYEIFSELDETKAEPPIFYQSFAKTKDKTEGGQGPASPPGGAAQPLAAPTCGETPGPPPDAAPSQVPDTSRTYP